MRQSIWEERAAMIAEFEGSGLTHKQVADRIGWCVSTVRRYRKMLGGDGVPDRPQRKPTEREQAMAAMYRSGKTLQEVGDLYGVSRERVRQILSRKFGIASRDGGKTVTAKAKRDAAKRARNARHFEKHGCSYADYRKLFLAGKRMVDAGVGYYRTPIGAFSNQRSNAARRGVEWNIKLWDWWKIWQESGQWENRGRERGQFVMCRFGDTGAYEVGNVYIATNSHNCSLQPNNPHRVDHADHKEAVREASERRSTQASRANRKRKYHHLPVGVTMCSGRFMAQISTGGKQRYLGSFDDADQAHAAYQQALSSYLNSAFSEGAR